MSEILLNIHSLICDYFLYRKSNLEEIKSNMIVPVDAHGVQCIKYVFDKDFKKEDNYPLGLFPFFKNIKKAHSMCDYCIFCDWRGSLYVLLFELKGGNSTTNQLNAGENFVKFIVSTINRIYDVNYEPHIRKIRVKNKNLFNKRRTKMSPVEYDDNHFYTFEGNTIVLQSLLK